MSGHFQPFGPRSQVFGQENQPFRPPFSPPNTPNDYPTDYNLFYPPNHHLPENFAEYSLWGTSPYNPSELIHTALNGPSLFGNHHPSPPYPPPALFCPDLEDKPTKMPSVPSEVLHTGFNGTSCFSNNHHSPPYPPSALFRPDYKEQPPTMPAVLSEIIHTAFNGPGGFGPHHYSPTYPPPALFCPDFVENPTKMPSVPPDVTQIEEAAVGGCDDPELTGIEEPEKTIISKAVLYKYDDNSDTDENIDTIEQISNSSGSSGSSGSSAGDWTNTNFQRAGVYPSTFPWASRPARVVNNRGKKANDMQRRLVRALSQPVKMDKGASMMQRMGWMGGGLGREESGIVSPVEPNAVYASTTVGFGQDVSRTYFQDPSTRTPIKKTKKKVPNNMTSKKTKKRIFKTNVLKRILAFLKNDMMLELYFDSKLCNSERKRIHMLVAVLDGREEASETDTQKQKELFNDIAQCNHFTLSTISEGAHPDRQICVYKSAPNHLFLVTPDDCRPCITEINEVEEESNPFMKSIAKHIKKDEDTIFKPKPPQLFDKLVEFFIDFGADDTFSEFRFLGPFTKKEVIVMNNFFNLIEDLSRKHKPDFKCPVELLNVFATDFRFRTHLDPNGFTAITKKAA